MAERDNSRPRPINDRPFPTTEIRRGTSLMIIPLVAMFVITTLMLLESLGLLA